MRRCWFVVALCTVVLLASCGSSPRTGTVENESSAGGYGGPYETGSVRVSPAVSPSPSAVTTAPAAMPSPPDMTASVPVAQQTATGTTVEIRVVNFGFEPAEVTVEVGTTVIWRNESPTTHTVTAKDGSFDSGLLEGGTSYSVTLTKPGTYDYWCTLHPEMVGRVIVR
ncbi:cupredoxin domain-containing protein [Thermomicrobium sp. 4228-Ro]|uniref:cupredoxin domain-containing protein n=1 Tax=Thermomicrobium sp. 4228-Ro TaxID=2993937 RepID=UPI0022494B6C|nr:cupredoxin domain-containing protein [Thermomicrobium sp. 4228-Ro]MCX2727753.1 cupredoxin domain-containing protein [Thermomicrobium sp. 4228-Ro]